MSTPQKRSLLAMVRRDWKNPPNLVTAARMVGALALPPLITGSQRQKGAGVGLFALLAATDKLDGWMAKNRYGSTELGKILDPAVDKELIGVSLASALADARKQKNTPLFFGILSTIAVLAVREPAVAKIKLDAQRADSVVESALQSGRVSMVAQSVAVGALLIPSQSPVVRAAKLGLLAAAVGTSLYSWWDYRRTYRKDP